MRLPKLKLNHAQRIVVALVVPALVVVGLSIFPSDTEGWIARLGVPEAQRRYYGQTRMASHAGYWLIAVVLVGAFDLWLWRSRPAE